MLSICSLVRRLDGLGRAPLVGPMAAVSIKPLMAFSDFYHTTVNAVSRIKVCFPFICVVLGSSCTESSQFEVRKPPRVTIFPWLINRRIICRSILRAMDRTELLSQAVGPKGK